MVRGAPLLLLTVVPACAVSPRPVEEVLHVETCGLVLLPSEPIRSMIEDAELRALADGLLVELDCAAAAAIAHAAGRPDDARAQEDAARRLFLSADLRLQRGSLDLLERRAAPRLQELLTLEHELRGPLGDEILSLAEEGLLHADRALALEPEDHAALLWRGALLSLSTFGLGTLRSITSGRGPEAWHAVEDVRARVPDEFEAAAPLRLEGRVLTQAPRPFRRLERAADRLRQAVELAPVPLNLLFLGDALALLGELEPAAESWRAALLAEPDQETAHVAPFHRALARARLVALSRE